MIRPLTDIKNDIIEHEQKIRELKEEIIEFQTNCPHPDSFVTSIIKDIEDDEFSGLDRYEYTIIEYKCALCEISIFGSYDRKKEPRPRLHTLLEK